MIIKNESELAVSIVRQILASHIDPEKIRSIKMKGYLSIQLDGDRYKTICRLYLNNEKRKYLGTISKNKVESRNRIENVSELHYYAAAIMESFLRYQASDL